MEDSSVFNALFQHATEGIVITNSRGEIIKVNPCAETLFQYETHELIGQKIEVLIPERHAKVHVAHRDNFNANPHARKMGSGYDLSAKKKNGEEFSVEISLSYFTQDEQKFAMAFIIDISERKKIEQRIKQYTEGLEKVVEDRTHSLKETVERLKKQIRENEETQAELDYSRSLFNTIASNYPIGSINVIDKDYNYIFTGGIGLKKQNLNGSELIGKPVFPSLQGEERKGLLKLMGSVFQGEKITDHEFPARFQNEIYTFDAFPLYTLDGVIEAIALFTKNVTEKRLAELEVKRSFEKEKELNQLKTRFVSIASHEFRTPLSAIKLSASLIEKYNLISDKENTTKHTHKIKSSVDNLTTILNDFLSADKLEEGKVHNIPSQLNLKNLAETIKDELQLIIKPGQEVNLLHTGPEMIFIDSSLLRGCMINLVSNAIKYSGENTSILLKTDVSSNLCTITVKDNGIGIPKESQKHLFEPFFRAHNTGSIPGTGLGLNIVKKYTSIMGGEIDFISKENEGTSFVIKIPIQQSN